MTGALSTPSLVVNSIVVEDELAKIGNIETKTTNISFATATDVTTVGGILNISTTEGLFVRQGETDELNVARTLDSIDDRTTGIDYDNVTGDE